MPPILHDLVPADTVLPLKKCPQTNIEKFKGHQTPLTAFNDCFVHSIEKCKKCATVKRD